MRHIRALIRRVCRIVVAWLDRTEPVQCGPLAGNWCPVCGNCICDCPLHGEHSRHAERDDDDRRPTAGLT